MLNTKKKRGIIGTISDFFKKHRKLETVISLILFVVFFSVVSNFVDKLTGTDIDSSEDNSTHQNLQDVATNIDKNTDPSEEAATSQKVTDSKKAAVTEAEEITAAAYADTEEDEPVVYPTKIIGHTVNEMFDLLGEPMWTEKDLLGGGGHDTTYAYGNYGQLYIASFSPESNFNYDDRDAVINAIVVLKGDVNEYVYADMPYSVLSETYALSEPVLFNGGNAMLDGKYVSTATITCNGLKCNMVAASKESGDNAPIILFMITANDLRN